MNMNTNMERRLIAWAAGTAIFIGVTIAFVMNNTETISTNNGDLTFTFTSASSLVVITWLALRDRWSPEASLLGIACLALIAVVRVALMPEVTSLIALLPYPAFGLQRWLWWLGGDLAALLLIAGSSWLADPYRLPEGKRP